MLRQESTDSGCDMEKSYSQEVDQNKYSKNIDQSKDDYPRETKILENPTSPLAETTDDDKLQEKTLRAWLKIMSSGLITDEDYKCCLGTFEIPGLDFKVRGIQATEKLNPGDIICKIPTVRSKASVLFCSTLIVNFLKR